jgi:hypothetical protein
MKIKVYVVDVKLPRWTRRALLAAVPALILGVGALVHAMSPLPAFNEGDVLTATLLNDRFKAITSAVPTVTDWKSYSSTVVSATATGTVTATTNAQYRRVGDSMEVNISTEFTACTATGQLRWSLPTGVTPDMAKLPYNFALIGHGTLLPATGLQVYAQGPSSTFVAVDYLGSTGGGMACTGPSAAVVKSIRLAFSFPVSGWTATGQ